MATREYKAPHFKRLNVIMKAADYRKLVTAAKKYRLTITQFVHAAIESYKDFLKKSNENT